MIERVSNKFLVEHLVGRDLEADQIKRGEGSEKLEEGKFNMKVK